MEQQYIALISGLIGAVVGAAASVITVLVQGHYQYKRDFALEGLRLALEDWKTRMTLVDKEGDGPLALPTFIHYHSRFAELSRNGKITPEALAKLNDEHDRLIEILAEYNRRTAARRAGA